MNLRHLAHLSDKQISNEQYSLQYTVPEFSLTNCVFVYASAATGFKHMSGAAQSKHKKGNKRVKCLPKTGYLFRAQNAEYNHQQKSTWLRYR